MGFFQESQLHDSIERYILIGINMSPLKAEKRTEVRLSAAPPPRGIQLDVKLLSPSLTDDQHRVSRR